MKTIITISLNLVYKFFVHINFVYGAAFIICILTKRYSKKKKYTVLALSKPVFLEDVKAIDEVSDSICFLLFPRSLLLAYIKKHALSYSIPSELNEKTYYPLIEGTKEQTNIYNDIEKLFTILHKYLRFDAIFSGNYTYMSQQEFCRVALNNNIPTIVLYKEGMAAPIITSNELKHKLYSNKQFVGTTILFYNEAIKNTLIKANIPGITESKSSVVGVPRFDKYVINKRIETSNETSNKQITLFAFNPETKANRFITDAEKKAAYIERGELFHIHIVRFCIEHPEFDLIVKVKSAKNAKNDVFRMLDKYKIMRLPNNIEIKTKVSSLSLIKEAAFVASFLSTTLLEAILQDKTIMCPYMYDIVGDEKLDFFYGHETAVNLIKCYDDVKDIIGGNVQVNMPTSIVKNKLLQPLIYDLDGLASKRAEKEIIKAIEENK